MEDLERRLRKRGTETEEQVSIRLRNASREMSCWNEYEYIIVSGSPEEDQNNFRAIMTAERMKVRRSRVPLVS
jgi:guanylate kinase